MIKVCIFDLSRTLLFPADKNYSGSLNKLYRELKDKPDFRFSEHYCLDEEILKFAQELNEKYKCDLCVFTSGSIQNDPAIKPRLDSIFKEIFSAEKLGVDKSELDAYIKLPELVGYKSDEIIYIDDMQENVEKARSAGLRAFTYTNVKNLREDIHKHFDPD